MTYKNLKLMNKIFNKIYNKIFQKLNHNYLFKIMLIKIKINHTFNINSNQTLLIYNNKLMLQGKGQLLLL